MATNKKLIQQYLPKRVRKIAEWFTIPEKFLKEKTDIMVLVLESRSMDTQKEKQSWFNLLPLMTQEQMSKLNDILTREKNKLAEIEKKYEEKKRSIKEKYIKRRESMGYAKKMDKLQKKENANRTQDIEDADNLLENL